MSNFHITAKGEVKPCLATSRSCPLGGQDIHFKNYEDAQEYLTNKSIEEHGLLPTLKDPQENLPPQENLVPQDSMAAPREYEIGEEVHRHLYYMGKDRNDSLVFHNYSCLRCGGAGSSDKWAYTGRLCYACNGSGKKDTPTIEKEYTPEYAKRLEERRKKRAEKRALEHPEETPVPDIEAPQEDLSELTPEPYESKHIGYIGEKKEVEIQLDGQFSFRTQYGTSTIYRFKDKEGNVLIWKTGSYIEDFDGFKTMTATIKEHSEYNGENQTGVIRPKFK